MDLSLYEINWDQKNTFPFKEWYTTHLNEFAIEKKVISFHTILPIIYKLLNFVLSILKNCLQLFEGKEVWQQLRHQKLELFIMSHRCHLMPENCPCLALRGAPFVPRRNPRKPTRSIIKLIVPIPDPRFRGSPSVWCSLGARSMILNPGIQSHSNCDSNSRWSNSSSPLAL